MSQKTDAPLESYEVNGATIAVLTDQINKALDEKDKDAFLTLSKEYAALKQSE